MNNIDPTQITFDRCDPVARQGDELSLMDGEAGEKKSENAKAKKSKNKMTEQEKLDAKNKRKAEKEALMRIEPELRSGKVFGGLDDAQERFRVNASNFRAKERCDNNSQVAFPKKIESVDQDEKISKLPAKKFKASAISWAFDLRLVSQGLGLPMFVVREMFTHARFMSQIAEEIAQVCLGLTLHINNKDYPGSDGFRIIDGVHYMVSIKNSGKKRCVALQYSSLTGRHGIFCDLKALRECLDNTHSIIIVDAMHIDAIWLTEVPSKAFTEWLDMGFFDDTGLCMDLFYKLLKQTCEVDKTIVTQMQRRKILKDLAKNFAKECEAIKLSQAQALPYDPFV